MPFRFIPLLIVLAVSLGCNSSRKRAEYEPQAPPPPPSDQPYGIDGPLIYEGERPAPPRPSAPQPIPQPLDPQPIRSNDSIVPPAPPVAPSRPANANNDDLLLPMPSARRASDIDSRHSLSHRPTQLRNRVRSGGLLTRLMATDNSETQLRSRPIQTVSRSRTMTVAATDRSPVRTATAAPGPTVSPNYYRIDPSDDLPVWPHSPQR